MKFYSIFMNGLFIQRTNLPVIEWVYLILNWIYIYAEPIILHLLLMKMYILLKDFQL